MTVMVHAGPRPRRICPWHLLDLAEDAEGEPYCSVGRGHRPRGWLVVDAAGRILAAGRACPDAPGGVLLDPPLPLTQYLCEVWLRLGWPRRTFGHGARQFRIPVAARRAIVARRKSVTERDGSPAVSAA